VVGRAAGDVTDTSAEPETAAEPEAEAGAGAGLEAGIGTGVEAVPGAEPDLLLSSEDGRRLDEWRRDAELLLAERQAAAGPVAVLLPDDLSVSDVVELGRYPETLARRLHRPLPRPPAPSARRGTAFHAWLERRSGRRALLAPDELPGADDGWDGVADGLDDGLGDGLGDGLDGGASGDPPDGPDHERDDASADELAALKAAFLGCSWAERQPVAVEVPFELVVGRHLVRGRIDAVYRRPDGGFDVVDYKTGRRPAGAAAEAAALQLSCYRVAWSELADVDPAEVGAAFLYVRDGDAGLVRPPLVDAVRLRELLDAVPEQEAP
jgi:DNA helicase-2/ATP-dependent DNA helicase PcrA